VLATQSIEARAREEGRASLYDWIVYKRGSKARERKEKNSSAARYLCGPRVTWLASTIIHVCKDPPFSTSAVILSPPPKKPALRLCMSVLYPWGILVFMLNRQPIVFTILALHPLVKVLQGSGFVRVLVIEFFKLLGAAYKVPGGVPGWV